METCRSKLAGKLGPPDPGGPAESMEASAELSGTPIPLRLTSLTRLRELSVQVLPRVLDPRANYANGRDDTRSDEGGNQDVLNNVLASFFLVKVSQHLNHLYPSFSRVLFSGRVMLHSLGFATNDKVKSTDSRINTEQHHDFCTVAARGLSESVGALQIWRARCGSTPSAALPSGPRDKPASPVGEALRQFVDSHHGCSV
jgi:hypothetical protein